MCQTEINCGENEGSVAIAKAVKICFSAVRGCTEDLIQNLCPQRLSFRIPEI